MRRRTLAISLATLMIASTGVALTGCSKTSSRLGAIRKHPAPELRSLANTRDETRNNWATVRTTNNRNFRDALGRALYVDRPSRLTPSSMPY